MQQIVKNDDGTFTVTLTEEELDAIRHPLGRVCGDHTHPIRQHTTALYLEAHAALGYFDDTMALKGYIEVHPNPRYTTSIASRKAAAQ